MDPIIPPVLVSAVSVVNGAIASVRNARDIAKQSSDSTLKDAVSEAYDAVLDLKDRVLELDEENRQLKAKLTQRESVKRTSEFGYYFKDGDDPDPLCPRCYEGEEKLAYLSPAKSLSGGIQRKCHQCDFVSWEKPIQIRRTVISRGPNSWMG